MAAQIILVQGDITEQHVDGAIHRGGGPAILAECRELRAGRYRGGLPTGQAVATTAGDLPARWVIHTVGPVYTASEDRSELLASCYRESLRVADELGAQTVAFPAVSAGIYGWPLAGAARIALTTVQYRNFAYYRLRRLINRGRIEGCRSPTRIRTRRPRLAA